MYWFLLLTPLVLLPIGTLLYIRLNPQFGGQIRPRDLEAFGRSKHWDGKIFHNLEVTAMDMSLAKVPKLLQERLTQTKGRSPARPLPIIPMDLARFQADLELPKFVWYGHSVLLLQIGGKNLLIDPMLGGDSTPIAPFTAKRFSENSLDVIDHLPPLDAILLTHDHYDHLDYASIQRLKGKCDTWLVALGVKRHLESWGIHGDAITEFDWWESMTLHGIELTFTPSRHFSGRGVSDRFMSLWGGWVFVHGVHKIYWSGDGGYGAHFKEVGERLGPFDWAFMECGQYNENWRPIHLFPEECVQAALDAGARWSIPVHWGGFQLAMHRWKEPVEQFTAAALAKGLAVCTPEIGAIVVMGEETTTRHWWSNVE
jgi:L-ascorbate metabolism protein UlaG (beta-lactamase superfamily)